MTLFSKFEVLEVPRDIRGKKYKLIDILIKINIKVSSKLRKAKEKK